MAEWADFPWNERLYTNSDETILTKALAAVENGYLNPAGGHSRYPGLLPFVTSLGGSKTYVYAYNDDIIAVTDQGRVFRVGQDGSVQDVTGVSVAGGNRVIFDSTDDGRVVMAAGGQIVQLIGNKTTVLSTSAPQSTHIQYIQGYLVAIEAYSGRFYYSDPGAYTTWNPLSVFTADAKPEPLVALATTPYNELMLAAPKHVEQWELLANGNQPFTRRWTTGQGVKYPYTLIADWTGTYGVNDRLEFVKFYGQISQEQSADVSLTLQGVDDWSEAWTAEISVKGQKHFLLVMPNATNSYGTMGITLLMDYVNRKWSFLFGWDAVQAQRVAFPIWSVCRIGSKIFAGVPGGVAVFDNATYTVLGGGYPFLIRSGHVGKWGPSRIDEVRLRLKRGLQADGSAAPAATIGMRWNLDNRGFDQWQYEDLGTAGEREMTIRWGGQGVADTWQVEIAVTDDVPVELVSMQCFVERMRW